MTSQSLKLVPEPAAPPRPDYAAILPTHVDSTMIASFRSCPHKFFEEFVNGLRPKTKNVDLHAGGCFSAALEVFYKQIFLYQASLEEARRFAMNTLALEWGTFTTEKDTPKTLDNMLVALDDYIKTYPPLTDHVQPLDPNSVEFSFAIPLESDAFPRHPVTGDPFLYAGRFDMLGSYMGRPCVKDDKTTKQAGASWADQWNLRSQFLGYVWAAQQSGFAELDTVVIRGVVVQKTSIRQLEAVKVYPRHLIERWYNQLCLDLWNICRCWEHSYWDYNLADSCTSYGGCLFTPICQATEDNQDSWRATYTVSRWDPVARDNKKIVVPNT